MPNIVLKRFMIFNIGEGQDEGCEGDKLLYHWVKDAPNNRVSLTEQLDDVCLSDASITTSIRLSTSNRAPNESQARSGFRVTTDQTSSSQNKLARNRRSLVLTFDTILVVMLEIEPELSIWAAVHVGFLHPANDITTQGGDSQQQPISGQFSDVSSISSTPIERVIGNIYDRFCLLNGTFQMITNQLGQCNQNIQAPGSKDIIRAKLRALCDDYFSSVLSEIHMDSIMTNIPSLYNYIVYLDLNPVTLMKVNSFINHLVCLEAEQISHTIAIFNDQLLWSSMNMHDSRMVYNYLVSVLIRDAVQEELAKELDKVRRIKENMPIFLSDCGYDCEDQEVLATDLHPRDSAGQISGSDKTKLSKYHLTIFRSSNNMTLGLILRDSNQFELITKCEHLLTNDSRLGVVPLASLAQSVGQNFLETSSISSSYNSPNTSTSANKKRPPHSSATSKNQLALDQNYICLDRLSSSATWSPNIESLSSQAKDQLLVNSTSDPNLGLEAGKKTRKLRLTRYLLELEPELEALKHGSHGDKDARELLAKTTSDTWLSVIDSRYKSIYSIYKMRNFGLNEAQQYARDLHSVMISHRLAG